jgi:diadenosine tetraphosphate (Ap4A) HIT family hydrolase
VRQDGGTGLADTAWLDALPNLLLVHDLKASQVRMSNDARFPWLVLIPYLAARELEDLPRDVRLELVDEALLAGTAVRAIGAALGRPVTKINMGLLGNVSPQLHVHVVGRRPDDPAWPGPVWGSGPAIAFATEALESALAAARAVFAPG